MKIVKCDICGKQFDPYDEDAIMGGVPHKERSLFGAICSISGDICGDCVRKGRKIPWAYKVIEVWRNERTDNG